MVKQMKQFTLTLILLALTILTGCNDTVAPASNTVSNPTITKEPALLDTQSIAVYSHSDDNGHWFVDTSFVNDGASLYVDYGTLATVNSEKYIVTYYDTDKIELKSIEPIE